MIETVELKDHLEVKAVVLAAFPGYKKRTALIAEFKGKTKINSYWDGGSRSEFAIVELGTLRRKPLPTSTHPYFDISAHGLANQQSEAVESDHVGNVYLKILPEGFALVEAGTFCGKPATAFVMLNVANLTKLLAVGVVSPE